MDMQSGESAKEEVTGEGIGDSEWRNWYKNVTHELT